MAFYISHRQPYTDNMHNAHKNAPDLTGFMEKTFKVTYPC